MKTINKIAIIGTKCSEVFFWLMSAGSALILVISFVARDFVLNLVNGNYNLEFTINDVKKEEIFSVNTDYTLATISIFLALTMVIMILYALVFRNSYFILKKANNSASNLDEYAPFQSDIVERLKKIGYILISVSIINFIAIIVLSFSISKGNIVFEFDMIVAFMGVLVLSLAEFFKHGVKLQQDVDGLL